MQEKDLSSFTNEELQSELKRRKLVNQKPKILKEPDFQKILNNCEKLVQNIEKERNLNNLSKFKEVMFDIVIQAVYGDSFYNWLTYNNFK